MDCMTWVPLGEMPLRIIKPALAKAWVGGLLGDMLVTLTVAAPSPLIPTYEKAPSSVVPKMSVPAAEIVCTEPFWMRDVGPTGPKVPSLM
jgi:hypothetical protein